MNKKIAKVVVGLPVDGPFDYLIKDEDRAPISAGSRVLVSFNRRLCVGYVVGFKQRSALKRLNTVIEVLDLFPALDHRSLALARSVSEFYGCSLGEALETGLPGWLRKKNKCTEAFSDNPRKKTSGTPQYHLVHDVTEGMSWPFIIEEVRRSLKNNGGVLILVPEKAYIDRVVDQLKGEINVPISFEKRIQPKKEFEQWVAVKKGDIPVVVGTRSMAFAPVKNLRSIIVFNEENIAYKQEQPPHYHARQVVFMRSRIEPCNCVFVSATPSSEVWKMSRGRAWERKVFEPEGLSSLQLIDMTNYNPRRSSLLSFPLQNALRKCFDQGGQAVLVMDRRGFSTITRCNQCGHVLRCEHCSSNLTYLYSKKKLVCRHCTYKTDLPKVCPSCNGSYLRSLGTGIEKLESEAARLYPASRVKTLDKESGAYPDKTELIIATQAVLKWRHTARPDLVAVIDYDRGLNQFDFRSAEKSFSMMVQLRAMAKERILIQTRMPDDHGLKALRNLDFKKFFREELKYRKELSLPPYRQLIAVGLRGPVEEQVFDLSNELFDKLKEQCADLATISDPHPSQLPKLRDMYRFTILLKAVKVKPILTVVKTVLRSVKKRGSVTITVDVDPHW